RLRLLDRDRLADDDPYLRQTDAAARERSSGADEPHRHDRCAGDERELRGATLPRAALHRALREDAEDAAAAQHLRATRERVAVAAAAVDRDRAVRVHHRRDRAEPPQLHLRQELHRPAGDEREKERIEHRCVVRGEHDGPRRQWSPVDLDAVEHVREPAHDEMRRVVEPYAQKRSSSASTSPTHRRAPGIGTSRPLRARRAIAWIAGPITVRSDSTPSASARRCASAETDGLTPGIPGSGASSAPWTTARRRPASGARSS